MSFNLDNILKLERRDKIIIKIANHLSKIAEYGSNIDKLNSSQKAFLLIESLEKEINSGGFNQFYFNSSGNFSHETVDALYKIGANKTAKIVEAANSKFPNGKVPKNWKERQDLSLKIDEDIELWNKQDEAFYKYEDNISELLINFVIKNKADFIN